MSQDLNVSHVFEVQTRLGRLAGTRFGQPDSQPPLVFLQGLAAPPEIWMPVIQALSQDRDCIAVDWPFGAHRRPLDPAASPSPPRIADAVVDLLDRLEIDEAILIGNDSGGAITQLVISEHPERVAAAALIACDAFDCFPPRGYGLLFRAARLPGVMRLISEVLSRRATAATRLGYGSVVTDAGQCHLWAQNLRADSGLRRDFADLMHSSSKAQTIAAAHGFSTFTKPVTVVWADNDHLFAPELGLRLANAFPNAQFRIAKNSRTYVPVDQPDQLTRFIHELVGRLA